MKTKFTLFPYPVSVFRLLPVLVLLITLNASAQLGTYSFTGTGTCPNQNPAVTTQPGNSVFSNYANQNAGCNAIDDVFQFQGWNNGNTIDLTQYNQFSVTPNAGYALFLNSIAFTQYTDEVPVIGNTSWILRSSLDNYTTDIATGIANTSVQSPVINLPVSFINIGAVTFRFYIINAKTGGTKWTNDEVIITGTEVLLPADPANPTSNSPQCASPGVTMNFTGSAPVGETWYWQTSANGTSTANSVSSYTVSTPGTYYVRAQDNTTMAWSAGAGSVTIAITPDVGTPVFALGSASTRCQGAVSVTYTATATNNTGITYSLDAASITAGNTINSSTGQVNFVAEWSGSSIITASAAGCNGPSTATHTVTTTPSVGTPVFTLGATSTRCQGAGSVTYTATAANNTGITYSLDATSLGNGNSINSATGAVTYVAGWSGTSTITASATGCNGPLTATHTVTITPTVGTPSFTLGASSTRCQGAGTITYDANASNTTGITYTQNAASATAGNTINAATGELTYVAGWSGTTIITASAAGCNGPKTATHTVTVTPTVGTPVFTLGAASTRCQGAGTVTYTATASNNTGITYSLDAASITGGNTINAATGAVTYLAGWTGTSVITATATGCNGPSSADHTVTISVTVGAVSFTLGSTSIRCQGAGTVTYAASAANTTGITYSLNAASIAGGNSINAATGAVTYVAGWSGTSIITATAAGCNGPTTATHTVTITPTVGTPVFALGAASSRCFGAATVTYSATATNNTGITYSLDAGSITGGNTINASTGEVTYAAGWIGTTIITASASGCNGPRTANHTVTVNGPVGVPVITIGGSYVRCQGNGNVNCNATAANNTGISYALDAASLAAGNTINTSNGLVNFTASWTGTSTVTVTATGCNGPTTATCIITNNANVGTPVFTMGATSTRCQGAGGVTYAATATNTTGITYTQNAASASAGNTINASTGEVTYIAGWSGTTIITASAAGCAGPRTATHPVTFTPTVGTPTFPLDANSTRCQGAGTVTYTSNATNNTGITYSLDAASLAGSNTINAATGAVTYVAGWSGTSVITSTASGCNGPSTASHTVTITPTVGAPVFTLGATSTRCQGSGTVNYGATATNSTSITYSLDAVSLLFGNTINSSNGNVSYQSFWSGTSVITASAAGCNGPVTATHTVTITPTVGTPSFTLGASSTRCQGANTVTYTATASNSTGITYALDAASLAGGNTINSATGAVTYVAGWTGTSIITATATGCNGPKTANHTVTNNSNVTTPVFTLGAATTRCQGAGTVTYTATATNTTGITYSLDAASITGGNSINASTGAVTYAAGWSGTSLITASAAGCAGPLTATHTVTITPTVGTPVFTMGGSSTRCQGAGTVTYTATSTNSTGLSYSIDGVSTAAGNTVNAATGLVTYVAGWNGTTTVIAISTGCNGPATSTHVVTVTPTVGTPAFAMGAQSVRSQGAGTITYSATATNSTSITYALDAASLGGGNTINAATGAVTWSAGWSGTSQITATAAGCNGPSTASHIVTINSTLVQAPLYLSDPGQILDRVDPVATGMTNTLQTAELSSTATTSVTFTQSPSLCNDLVIKAQAISVVTYVTITNGSMPVNPAITATLSFNGNTIISMSNPIYNSGTGQLTWSGVLGADVTIPTGMGIDLNINTSQGGVKFKIDYHSSTKPSRISLLPVTTFIDILSFHVYNAPYPGGLIRTSGTPGSTMYARAVVTTPFGYKDITGLTVTITPPGTAYNAVCVDSSTCTRTYQYAWTVPAGAGPYYLMATAREGYENIIKNSELVSFSPCVVCAPVAVTDSASGAGGAPITLDVLANDYDPNGNMQLNTLAVNSQPNNGTGYLSNGKIVYLPNGSYSGRDTMTYRICDSTGLCSVGQIYLTINPFLVDPCSEATQSHTYYLPFSENEARIALDSSTSNAFPSNNIRTVISMKMPYPGMVIVWDHWEDGYEVNPLNPLQTTTQVWGDGNPYNGITPGYASDIIPAGGSIVLDNTIPTNPRVQANIFFDGKDKIHSSGQITVTQVCGEPSIMQVQCMKTNVSPTLDYGTSFTIPVGQNYNSQDFRYTSLFIRASKNNTTVNVDKDNNGSFEVTQVLNEGQVMHVNGGVLNGATITATEPVGVDLHFGGNDGYSSRDVPIFPATWYYHTYYSPVPTTGRAQNPADTNVVMLYNSLNRPLDINYTSGIPSSGTITIPARTTIRFPLPMTQTAAFRFSNPTGESFTAIQICDSYTPGGGGNTGTEYDWAFNLIAQNRLTDLATVAWAPGSIDGTRNDNPIWVTPTANTTIYVKYNGNISGTSGLVSPCGLRYDVSYTLNALTHRRLLDAGDNDQSGLAVFTCDGTKLAAVYGEDASTAVTANPSWDVGTTIQPFCKQKLIFANDDYSRTMVNQPVTIPILLNDFGFLAVIDPTSVSTTGLLQPKHGSVTVNANGTVLYTPNTGYVGKDTFEYSVCSTPSPIVCDIATVYVDIAVCPAPFNQNIIGGMVFLDKNKDGMNNDGGTGVAGTKVYLYVDGNCNTTINPNELRDSVTTDASGTYQFVTYPEKFVYDDFDGAAGASTCATGTDGSAAWLSNWVDAGDPSTGYCNTGSSAANTDCDIFMDAGFSNAIRLKDNNVSATRTVNLSGASYAFLSFSYRRKSATLTAGEDVIVQASTNGSTFGTIFTIAGDGNTDAGYVNIYNQDITAYAAATTYIRFLTNNSVDDADTVYIDNVKVQFIRYPQCYITSIGSSTIPAYHYMSTPTEHAMTATGSTTCLAPYDYGVAKMTIAVSGNLYNDANGLTDNLINGTGTGTVSGSPMYAYIVDTSGLVAYKTTLVAGTGAFSFPAVDVLSNYVLKLSTTSVNVGSPPPADISLPAGWVATGDSYGLNNGAGTGIKAGNPNGSVALTTAAVNVTNVNFGVERLPDSDPKLANYGLNRPGI